MTASPQPADDLADMDPAAIRSGSDASLIRDLVRVKAMFQLRALGAVLDAPPHTSAREAE